MAEGLSVRLRQEAPIPLQVDLAVDRNETLALVGPSGAGKTTVLRAIAGLAAVREGAVTCGGEVWLDTASGIHLPARRRRVGMVFQSYALFPHLSALANVEEAMRELAADQRHRRARDLLAMVHLERLEDRKPRTLSGGQQQRVALARALAREPRALLLDEPFSAVDRPTRRALQALLGEIRREVNIPIVLVTHDVDGLAAVADRLCFVEQGQQREIGPAAALLDDPRSEVRRWLDGAAE